MVEDEDVEAIVAVILEVHRDAPVPERVDHPAVRQRGERAKHVASVCEVAHPQLVHAGQVAGCGDPAGVAVMPRKTGHVRDGQAEIARRPDPQVRTAAVADWLHRRDVACVDVEATGGNPQVGRNRGEPGGGPLHVPAAARSLDDGVHGARQPRDAIAESDGWFGGRRDDLFFRGLEIAPEEGKRQDGHCCHYHCEPGTTGAVWFLRRSVVRDTHDGRLASGGFTKFRLEPDGGALRV